MVTIMKKLNGLDTKEALALLKSRMDAMDDKTFFETLGIDLEELQGMDSTSLRWENNLSPNWSLLSDASSDFASGELLNCAA